MYIAVASTFPDAFYIATTILFAILTPPILYVWWRHGLQGFLGYNFVWSICAIKIVGSALSLATKSHPDLGTAAAILNSMTISPLILAALGVLQESRKARYVMCRERHDRMFVVLLHGLVLAGMALIIVGIVHAVEDQSTSTDASHVKIGLALLAVSWAIVCVAALYSLWAPGVGMFPSGVKLLYAVLISLPFIGVRLIYGMLVFLLRNPTFAQSLGAKVILSLIPEFITVAIFVVAGIVTRDMWREDSKEPEHMPVPVQFREVLYSYSKYRTHGDSR